MKINGYNEKHHLDLSGSVGVVASSISYNHTSLGSNTPLIESGAGAPGSGPQAAAWDHVHPALAGGSSSFGSNSTRVSSVSAAGASSSNSRADHVHDGIGTVTASGSNTLNRGTVNLRAGTNIDLSLSNTGGGSGFDTVTINSLASGGSGGGSVSYGSNSNAVSAPSAAGASTLVSRADHVHDGSLVLLETRTASSSATLDFSQWVRPAFDTYMIQFLNILPATNIQQFRLRWGLGTVSSASNYNRTGFYNGVADVVTSANSTAQASIGLADSVRNDTSSLTLNGTAYLYNPADTSTFKQVVSDVTAMAAAAGRVYRWSIAATLNTTTGIDRLQFFFASGNIASGTIRVFGVPK